MAAPRIPLSKPPTPGTKASPLVNQISEYDLHRAPSCIQFVPHPQYADHLVVGTYQLEPDEVGVELTDAGSKESPSRASASVNFAPKAQYRNGTLALLKYVDGQLSVVDTVECPSAVYDLHFLPETTTTFATASSTGIISFYHVRESMRCIPAGGNISETTIQPLGSVQVLSPTTIITYFEIIPAQNKHFGPLIAATADDGGMYLMSYCLEDCTIDLLNDGKPITKYSLRFLGTADYAWCCASSYSNGKLSIYSGSDGGELTRETITFSNGQIEADKIVSQVRGFHSAGVTAILPLSISADTLPLILTGSYDEHVRLYSVNEEKVLAKFNLGGGVYRLKFMRQLRWNDSRSSYTILACCMHAGTKILDIQMNTLGEWTIDVVADLNVPGNNPNNYCYAADFPHSRMLFDIEEGTYRGLCVSGTFVDKTLAVWEFKYRVSKEKRGLESENPGAPKSQIFHLFGKSRSVGH